MATVVDAAAEFMRRASATVTNIWGANPGSGAVVSRFVFEHSSSTSGDAESNAHIRSQLPASIQEGTSIVCRIGH